MRHFDSFIRHLEERAGYFVGPKHPAKAISQFIRLAY